MIYSTPPEWPIAQPDDLLNYSLDLTAPLASITDTIGSVSVSVSPQNELPASNVSFSGGVVSVWPGNGGIAGRTYQVKIDVIGADTGMEISKTIALPISSISATYSLPAEMPGWSAPVTS
ncbi:hypothetical protein [Acidisphaera sp. S103]|uniref:phage fiber-tail adaptor protein n=1 Tax=Acidisphaera sp. S103 TaxID=1747223 RepID=UPI00131D4120|nr:hypothetical protein [Acidisphaera sp. S103]